MPSLINAKDIKQQNKMLKEEISCSKVTFFIYKTNGCYSTRPYAKGIKKNTKPLKKD